MTRKELYARVKELGIADEIKNTFGKNFTQVSNDNLEMFVLKSTKAEKPKTIKKADAKPKEVKNIDKAMVKLVSTLQYKGYLTTNEVDDVLSLL